MGHIIKASGLVDVKLLHNYTDSNYAKVLNLKWIDRRYQCGGNLYYKSYLEEIVFSKRLNANEFMYKPLDFFTQLYYPIVECSFDIPDRKLNVKCGAPDRCISNMINTGPYQFQPGDQVFLLPPLPLTKNLIGLIQNPSFKVSSNICGQHCMTVPRLEKNLIISDLNFLMNHSFENKENFYEDLKKIVEKDIFSHFLMSFFYELIAAYGSKQSSSNVFTVIAMINKFKESFKDFNNTLMPSIGYVLQKDSPDYGNQSKITIRNGELFVIKLTIPQN